MPFPLIAAGALLGAKLLSGLSKGKEKKKKAESLKRSGKELYTARKGQYDANQARRTAKLNAVQGAIGKVGESLPGGAPDYSFDPAVLAEMQKPLPYGETPESLMSETSGDPTAGAGYGMLGGIADTVGDTALDYLVGQTGQGDGFTPVKFDPSQVITGSEDLGPSGVATPDLEEVLRGGLLR